MNETQRKVPEIDIRTGVMVPDTSDTSAEAEQARELDQIQERVAQSLLDYSLEIQNGDKLLIKLSPGGWQLASKVMRLARERGVEVMLRYSDTRFLQPGIKAVIEGTSAVVDGKFPPKPVKPADEDENANPKVEEQIATPDPFPMISPDRGENREPMNPSHDRAKAAIVAQAESGDKNFSTDALERAYTAVERAEVEDYLAQGPLADEQADELWATRILVIREATPSTDKLSAESIYRAGRRRVSEITDPIRWALIYTPTEDEAKRAGISLYEYTKMYYDACDQPWDEIEKAQAVLVETLKEAKTFSVDAGAPTGFDTDRWSTHITMSIEGMIGANSVAKRNIPGNEVFLAPVAGTLEGQYAIPYPVLLGSRVIKNIAFRFEHGKVVEFWMKDPNPGDEEYVRERLNDDEGASMVGELGIGGNSKVLQAYLNTLLVEKACGSIHLALGKAYEETEYLGQEINIDNGVRSQNHFDLTRMLTAEYGGGQIRITRAGVDGNDEEVLLQKDGYWQDQRLAILNPAA